jgi:hypothetical protein
MLLTDDYVWRGGTAVTMRHVIFWFQNLLFILFVKSKTFRSQWRIRFLVFMAVVHAFALKTLGNELVQVLKLGVNNHPFSRCLAAVSLAIVRGELNLFPHFYFLQVITTLGRFFLSFSARPASVRAKSFKRFLMVLLL